MPKTTVRPQETLNFSSLVLSLKAQVLTITFPWSRNYGLFFFWLFRGFSMLHNFSTMSIYYFWSQKRKKKELKEKTQ